VLGVAAPVKPGGWYGLLPGSPVAVQPAVWRLGRCATARLRVAAAMRRVMPGQQAVGVRWHRRGASVMHVRGRSVRLRAGL